MSEIEKAACPDCRGSGKCLRCNGNGNIVRRIPMPISVISGAAGGQGQPSRICPKCYGSGMCQTCKGTGKTN